MSLCACETDRSRKGIHGRPNMCSICQYVRHMLITWTADCWYIYICNGVHMLYMGMLLYKICLETVLSWTLCAYILHTHVHMKHTWLQARQNVSVYRHVCMYLCVYIGNSTQLSTVCIRTTYTCPHDYVLNVRNYFIPFYRLSLLDTHTYIHTYIQMMGSRSQPGLYAYIHTYIHTYMQMMGSRSQPGLYMQATEHIFQLKEQVRMCVCVCICVFVNTRTQKANKRTCISAQSAGNTCVWAWISVCMCVCVRLCVCMYMRASEAIKRAYILSIHHVCVYVCVYIYTYMRAPKAKKR